jgi:hypothetical protein
MTIHTPETKAEVARLAATGLSASQIAAEMGLASRHVVIGMADRYPDLIRLQGKAAGGRPKSDKPKPEHDAPDDLSTLITIYELTETTCRYPNGMHDYRFCGKPTFGNSPYCKRHSTLCFHPKG